MEEDRNSPGSAARNRARLATAQEAFFLETIRLCFRGHPYYRELFRRRGLRVEDFQSLDDLGRLPLTGKADFMTQPERFRLRLAPGPDVRPEEQTVWQCIYTTGSTGAPAPFYDTTHDHFSRIHQMKRACEIAGLRPQDVVLNLFPLTAVPHQGFLSALWGPFSLGAPVVAALGGRPYPGFPVHNDLDRVVDLAERRRVTVLWGISTYVRRVILRAQERGKDLSAVRLVFAMGEPCPRGMREDLRQRLGATGAEAATILSGYGFTEVQGPAMECVEMGGYHLPTPAHYRFEILDPATLDAVPEGAEGLVVISHLNRRGTVLLRYMVGDVCALTHQTCPHCGRSEPRFVGRPRRVDNLVKVKGTLVNLALLQDALSELQPEGLLEYQVVLAHEDAEDPYSADSLVIRLACAEGQRVWLPPRVASLVRRVTEVTPRLEWVPLETFHDQAALYKFRRFVDERRKPDEGLHFPAAGSEGGRRDP